MFCKYSFIRYKVSDVTNIKHISLKQFLSHIDTKQDLTVYLSKYIAVALEKAEKCFVITYDLVSITNIQNIDENLKSHDHEEADTLLVLHAIDVAKRDPFCKCVIFSPDTDVFLLLVYYSEVLPQMTSFRTGKGDNQRDIDISICFEALGPLRSNSILGFHVFTGCDQIGRFNGKSKSSCWNTFMKTDEDVLLSFLKLGNNEDLPNLETLENLERFVVQLYGGSNYPNKDITHLAELRWHLFSKFQQDAEKLPPTMSALKYKVFRAHYVSMTLRKSHVSLQRLPPAINYGWENNNGVLVPIMTDNLPAPLALIELSVCGCQSDCCTDRCKCRKNKLVCTDMCKCNGCENSLEAYDNDDDDFDYNSDNSDED